MRTTNEPHFLLPLLFSLKDYDVRSTYNHFYAAKAVQDYCDTLPNGVSDYLACIREFALNLYGKGSKSEVEIKYFLDKTPKYHFIAEDIIHLFPEAKFIFLWRNPLSVLSSLIDTWGGGFWNIYHFKVDLYQGLENLINAYRKYADKAISIQFEEILLEPVDTIKKVFSFLDLPFDPQVLNNFSKVQLNGRVQDPNIHKSDYQTLNQAPLLKWKTIINNPLRKNWSRNYLRWIGKDRLAIMGYELENLLLDLNSIPITWHHVLNDAYRIPFGEAYHIFELQLFKQKYLSWRKGQRIYMHN